LAEVSLTEIGRLLGGKLRFRRTWLTAAYPVLMLSVLIVAFGIGNPNFLTHVNFMNILRQLSILLIVSVAESLIILMGCIDLSIGSIVTVSGALAAVSVPTLGAGALLVAAAVGLGAGLFNGMIFTKLRIPSFLVTLGALSAFNGAANLVSTGRPILYISPSFDFLAQGSMFFGIPNVVIWSFLIMGVMYYVAFNTRFGRYLFAIGGGEKVASLSGVPVNRYKIYAFLVAGLLCGIAGGLLTSRIGAGTPRSGEPLLLDCIAAVVIGGTALTGGVGGPQWALLGVLVITILSNGLNVMNVNPFVQEVIKGLVVIGAVAVSIDRSKYEMVK
jgi:ribose transport system permease protein/putative xylitol transport system permease protein